MKSNEMRELCRTEKPVLVLAMEGGSGQKLLVVWAGGIYYRWQAGHTSDSYQDDWPVPIDELPRAEKAAGRTLK